MSLPRVQGRCGCWKRNTCFRKTATTQVPLGEGSSNQVDPNLQLPLTKPGTPMAETLWGRTVRFPPLPASALPGVARAHPEDEQPEAGPGEDLGPVHAAGVEGLEVGDARNRTPADRPMSASECATRRCSFGNDDSAHCAAGRPPGRREMLARVREQRRQPAVRQLLLSLCPPATRSVCMSQQPLTSYPLPRAPR